MVPRRSDKHARPVVREPCRTLHVARRRRSADGAGADADDVIAVRWRKRSADRIVARRRDNDHAGCPCVLDDRLLRWIARTSRPEAQVDHSGALLDRPLDAGDLIAQITAAIVAQDLAVEDLRARRDAGQTVAVVLVGGDDARDVRAVPEDVGSARRRRGEVLRGDDPTSQVFMCCQHSGIQHGHLDPVAVGHVPRGRRADRVEAPAHRVAPARGGCVERVGRHLAHAGPPIHAHGCHAGLLAVGSQRRVAMRGLDVDDMHSTSR